MNARICFLLILLFSFSKGYTQSTSNRTIAGMVVDASTQERLANVLIKQLPSGIVAFSNTEGWFAITVTTDSVILGFSHVGYVSQQVVVPAGKENRISIQLHEQTYSGEVIEVVAGREHLVNGIQPSSFSLNRVEMARIPAFFGQTDILKTFQMLPGVQPGAEGTSGLYIRGGSTDQTLILLDGAPVYFAFHSSGFVTAFSSESIQTAELITGGIPARFGNRIGSVMQLTVKEGNQQRWTGSAAIGMIYGSVQLHGPVSKGKSTLLFDGRHSLFNGFMRAFEAKNQHRGYILPLNDFYDLSIKYSHKLERNRKVSISLFSSLDELDDSRMDSVVSKTGSINTANVTRYNLRNTWQNNLFNFRLVNREDARTFSTITAYVSAYQSRLFEERSDTEWINRKIRTKSGFTNENKSGITEKGIKYDRTTLLSQGLSSDAGISFTASRFQTGIRNLTGFEGAKSSDSETNLPQHDTKFYSADAYNDFSYKGKWIDLRSGLRFTAINTFGSSSFFFQPRQVINIRLGKRAKLKSSFTKSIQTLHLLVNNGFGASTDVWIPVTKYTPAEHARTYSVGLVLQPANDIDFSVEWYNRKVNGLVEYKEGAYFNEVGNVIFDQVTTGSGIAKGWEFYFRKHSGRLTMMMSYTYSLSERIFPELNNGNPYLFKYDRRHNVSMTANLRTSKYWDFSANWIFMNGHRLSVATQRMMWYRDAPDISGNAFLLYYYSSRNNFQLGWYHRLDLSAHYVRKWRTRTIDWNFGLYNAYNQMNPAFAFPARITETGRYKVDFYYLFPVMPFISLKTSI